MTNVIPRAIADVELQLASAISIGTTSFTLNSANDDDGIALPSGLYCFALDSGTSNKEYLIGQLNGVNVTSVKSVGRQGAETTGAARPHRVGSPCIITNFATLQRVADILRGALDLDGASPVAYDAEPTLSDREQLATVGYVLDNVTGGTVSFDKQTVAGTGGATIVAGNLIYFDEADQEWKLCDADTAATVEGVMRGIALGSGSDGVAITGGVHLAGVWTTTGLTAGAVYYASNTAGAISTSAGTTKHIVGVALSTTRLWVIPQHRETISTRTKDAAAGGGYLGTPSTGNKFLTEAIRSIVRQYDVAGSPHTWTKPAGLVRVRVQAWGGGGSGGANTGANYGGGGGGGGYFENWFEASQLGPTETVTVGAGGTAVSGATNGNAGANSTFGSLLTARAGSGGLSTGDGGAGGDIQVGSTLFRGAQTGSGTGNPGIYWGGASGGAGSIGGGKVGGSALWGGAGGGGSFSSAGSNFGGDSIYGGDGGVGGDGSINANGVAGSVPGGGGGGANDATSGAGGAGRVIVTEFYA